MGTCDNAGPGGRNAQSRGRKTDIWAARGTKHLPPLRDQLGPWQTSRETWAPPPHHTCEEDKTLLNLRPSTWNPHTCPAAVETHTVTKGQCGELSSVLRPR